MECLEISKLDKWGKALFELDVASGVYTFARGNGPPRQKEIVMARIGAGLGMSLLGAVSVPVVVVGVGGAVVVCMIVWFWY